ncbi:MAG: L-threonylcarbamoyladenylate synthase [Hyphomicrobiaceae bacterium]|jgi:L-threonylcarbamoyladenylate synthase
MAIVEATAGAIAAAAQALRQGELVAFPTETVYGLGADATNGRAVAAIFTAKGRPRFNPLIAHVPDVAAVERLGRLGELGRKLSAAFWPGPLSLVMAKREGCPVSDLATAGLDTIALRVPSHPVAQALLRAVGRPVAAPSANRSGHVSPTTAAHVEADLGAHVAMILDGGPTSVGLESTVVDVTGDEAVILRVGGVSREAIARALGVSTVARAEGEPGKPSSPGMLARHYAPAAKLRINAREVKAGEALLAFGANVPEYSGPMVNLSPSGDLIEAAANLFAALRTLDSSGVAAIAVMPIPNESLGEAINDRLRRGAK